MEDGGPVAVDSDIVLHEDISTALDGGSDGGAVGLFEDGPTVNDGVELSQDFGAGAGVDSLGEGRVTIIVEGVDVKTESDEEAEYVDVAPSGSAVEGAGACLVRLEEVII